MASIFFKESNMEYRNFGKTGLLVSALSYGNHRASLTAPFEEQVEIIKTCLQNGINFFDTAEIYSAGKDEEVLGKLLKAVGEKR